MEAADTKSAAVIIQWVISKPKVVTELPEDTHLGTDKETLKDWNKFQTKWSKSWEAHNKFTNIRCNTIKALNQHL